MDNSSADKSRLNQTVLTITSAFTVILPILFLPIINNQFTLPKTLLSLITAIALVIAYTISSLKRKKLGIDFKPAFIPVIILLSGYLGSTFLQSNNPYQ